MRDANVIASIGDEPNECKIITYNESKLLPGFVEHRFKPNRELVTKYYDNTNVLDYRNWHATRYVRMYEEKLPGKCCCSHDTNILHLIEHNTNGIMMWVGSTCATYYGANHNSIKNQARMVSTIADEPDARFCINEECGRKIGKLYSSDMTRVHCIQCKPKEKKELRLCLRCNKNNLRKDQIYHKGCLNEIKLTLSLRAKLIASKIRAQCKLCQKQKCICRKCNDCTNKISADKETWVVRCYKCYIKHKSK